MSFESLAADVAPAFYGLLSYLLYGTVELIERVDWFAPKALTEAWLWVSSVF